MHENTIKVIHWIWGEPKLADFLREVAAGKKIRPHDDVYGSENEHLAAWINDFVMPEDRSRGIKAWNQVVGGDEDRVIALYEELTEDRKTPDGRLKWLSEVEWNVIRGALLGDDSDTPLYVHSTVKWFHPNNRYRVSDKDTVYAMGWTSAAGAWGMAESERQVCPRPDLRECGCTVVQHGD